MKEAARNVLGYYDKNYQYGRDKKKAEDLTMISFEGKTIRTRGFRLVSQPPQPVPIYLAALMPPMLSDCSAPTVTDGPNAACSAAGSTLGP